MSETKIKKIYAIGIDAGVKTGFAVYNREVKKITFHATLDFWRAYKHVLKYYDISETVIYIENPNSKNAIYSRFDETEESKVRESMARRIGSNRREATLLIEGFALEGYEVKEVKPTTAKWSKEYLERVTGITARTSEHVRDAIKLVYGI